MIKHDIAEVLVNADCYISMWHESEWVTLPNGSEIPAYLSVRKMLSQPRGRNQIESALDQAFKDNFQEADLVVGLATAGIPWAAAVARNNSLPLSYVRSGAKGYGVGNLIEGSPAPGSRAVIIDDTLFSGESLRKAIGALREERNITTVGMLVVASLCPPAVRKTATHDGLKLVELTTYEEICEVAQQSGCLSPDEARLMRLFYETHQTGVFQPDAQPKKATLRRSISLTLLALLGVGLHMPRGGNYKAVRSNLVNQGKANAKQPMPPEQKRLRRRKRKKN